METLPAPPYTGPLEDDRPRVALAVESMRRHLTDEGWQLMAGLEHAGYDLAGRHIVTRSARWGSFEGMQNLTDVPAILAAVKPGTVVIQDKREWLGLTAGKSRDPDLAFRRVEALAERPDVFKVGVIKDAQNDHALHVESATEMGTHCWLTPYDLDAVARIAPFLRRRHLIRTYHTIEPADVPPYRSEGRAGCLLSGALSGAYPLRCRLAQEVNRLPDTDLLRHPGYRAAGCKTPEYLRKLSGYKVAICTTSRYGYALRKLIEATAAGCIVVTDLPKTDRLPAIDVNLVRVEPGIRTHHMAGLLADLYEEYDPERQAHLADAAKRVYDFRAQGTQLAIAIESMRRTYSSV